MPTVDLCNAVYDRPVMLGGERLLCQFIKDHPGDRHSHYTVSVVDDAEMEARALADAKVQSTLIAAAEEEDNAPPDTMALMHVINGLSEGKYDPYIELLLATGHDRKRALRGVRGFPRTT